MSKKDDAGVERLKCEICEESVTLARIGVSLKLVCQCTQDEDRMVEPVSPDSLYQPVMPNGWTFVDGETGEKRTYKPGAGIPEGSV